MSGISLRDTRRLSYDCDIVVRQSICKRFIAHGTGLRATTSSFGAGCMPLSVGICVNVAV